MKIPFARPYVVSDEHFPVHIDGIGSIYRRFAGVQVCVRGFLVFESALFLIWTHLVLFQLLIPLHRKAIEFGLYVSWFIGLYLCFEEFFFDNGSSSTNMVSDRYMISLIIPYYRSTCSLLPHFTLLTS